MYHKKCENADNYYTNNLNKKVFKSWQKQTKHFKLTNQTVNAMFSLKQKEKCLNLFRHWRNEAKMIKAEKKDQILADAFYLKHLLLKSLKAWSLYATTRILKKNDEKLQIEKFKKIKALLVSKSIFETWKRRTNECLNLNNKEENSKHVYQLKLCKKAFMAWRIYIKHVWRKKLLNSQAQWFLDTRFKTEFYFKWKVKYENECKIREKNQKALIYWSITIQREFFFAWLEWIRFKKHKKARYQAALEQRQLDILKICGRNFLNYSMDARVRRMVGLRHLKEKNLIDTSDLQMKYFRIWYNKCKFNLSKTIVIEPKVVRFNHEISNGITLTKREDLKDSTYVSVKLDVQSKVRPAPRKPIFLNESTDLTPKLLPETKSINLPKIKEIEVKQELTFNKAILLPPSAFASSREEPNCDRETSLVSSSLSTIDRNEMSFELKNLMSFHDVSIPLNSDRSTKDNEASSYVKPRKDRSKIQYGNELIKLKKRLENLSKKSEKLKYISKKIT
jgi:hypothetical protein